MSDQDAQPTSWLDHEGKFRTAYDNVIAFTGLLMDHENNAEVYVENLYIRIGFSMMYQLQAMEQAFNGLIEDSQKARRTQS